MRRLIVLAASLAPLLAFTVHDVSAQALSGGPPLGGGVRMGGALSGGGSRALSTGGFGGGYRLGTGGYGGYRGGAGWGYRPNRWYGGGYYGRGYYRRGYYDNWGWGAGALAAGAIIGSAAAYPYYYYGAPYYDEPAYYYYSRPYYAVPAVPAGIGAYCQTPVRTCRLINPSGIGGGCSCRVAGGRARGTVVP